MNGILKQISQLKKYSSLLQDFAIGLMGFDWRKKIYFKLLKEPLSAAIFS